MQLGSHPLFQRVASMRKHKVFSKGKEVADDLRERWETSDSPFVHRIQVRSIIFLNSQLLGWSIRTPRAVLLLGFPAAAC